MRDILFAYQPYIRLAAFGGVFIVMAGLEREPIVLVCRTNTRSAVAARTLRAAGFTQVRVLRQGMAEWNEAGLEVEDGRAIEAAA